MVKGYTGVNIPNELAERVKKFVEKKEYGYRTFAEFVIDAVRRRVEELEREERFRKVQERKGVWSEIDEK